jgi:hypothetical protein
MDGCRDGNVGFAKAEVRGGYFALNVTLCGIRHDAPEGMGIYLLFDRNAGQQTYNMLPVGTAVVNCGKGSFKDIFNPSDIASSGYCFDEIKGIAVLAKNDTYYTCFSLWEADTIDPAKCVYLPKGFRRAEAGFEENSSECEVRENEYGAENQENSIQENVSECEVEENNLCENCETDAVINDNQERDANKIDQNSNECEAEENNLTENCQTDRIINNNSKLAENQKNSIQEDFINAFDDDYFYDCMEVTPDRVRELVGEDGICDNSFVMHGFYTYRHLLFGKVAKNNSGTEYFIGVPGMYSNRERYLATMFGFCNFRKSHRSDYANPYFGYWYMEV